MLNLCLAFFSSPRNGSVRGKVSLVLNLYGLRSKAALPRTDPLRGDENEQKNRLNLNLSLRLSMFFKGFLAEGAPAEPVEEC